ncbi:hypothetical protein CR513_05237, partial [Mucuna pruriens]
TNVAKLLNTSIKDKAWCWHEAWHLNFEALKTLRDEKMVNEVPHIKYSNQFRKTWVYFLKQKSEIFVVEKESDYVIKALRSDKDDKFTSKEFNEFCEKKIGFIIL